MNKRQRVAIVNRKTKETDIHLRLNLDGTGKGRIKTGINFLDHMLTGFARHGLFDLNLRCKGDLHIDAHHSVEDIGIALGQAFALAAGDKSGLVRYGHAYVPMDETLVRGCVDFSGRPYTLFKVKIPRKNLGDLDTELVEHFFESLGTHARINLHLELLYGKNSHHICEACFKACARALCAATRLDPRVVGVPSTKGRL
ncbi:MAG: imidazoleglycerol-phosphate dehydratase HisB [Acidobacteriia bacterium]|nr:imidazoleglycerol-phosphate dehydratase HisB [Terriglobia bacterium]